MSTPRPRRRPAGDPLEKDTKQNAIIRRILRDIESGRLKVGDPIPSITAMLGQTDAGRDTIVKAYDSMKAMGIVDPVHGKGFFVATQKTDRRIRTLVLFDTLFNGFKERVLDGIRERAGERLHIDFFSHNFSDEAFVRTLLDKQNRYERLVVMPYESAAVKDCLSKLDQDKLLLLDIDIDFPGKDCPVVMQDFLGGTESALENARARLTRYDRMELVLHKDGVQIPEGIRTACKRFCRHHGIPLTVTNGFREKGLAKGVAYFVIDDTDMVALIAEMHRLGLVAGRDVGILSYNDTPVKTIIEEGTTVVSTDFRAMGVAAAEKLLNRIKSKTIIPTSLIARKTL